MIRKTPSKSDKNNKSFQHLLTLSPERMAPDLNTDSVKQYLTYLAVFSDKTNKLISGSTGLNGGNI